MRFQVWILKSLEWHTAFVYFISIYSISGADWTPWELMGMSPPILKESSIGDNFNSLRREDKDMSVDNEEVQNYDNIKDNSVAERKGSDGISGNGNMEPMEIPDTLSGGNANKMDSDDMFADSISEDDAFGEEDNKKPMESVNEADLEGRKDYIGFLRLWQDFIGFFKTI